MIARVVALIAVVAATAHADPTCDLACTADKAREMLGRGDAVGARDMLERVYQAEPHPQLLFALGQVEQQLGRFEVAIDYYEKFIATKPSDEHVDLAQQAIGAARAGIARRGIVTRAVRRRHWDVENTGLVALGGVVSLAGGALLFYSHHLAGNRSGTLADYDTRLDQAKVARLSGAGLAVAGVVVVGAALVRWRLSGELAVVGGAGPSAATVGVEGRW
jgi:tetratricopeptide (TPR) repeat protein